MLKHIRTIGFGLTGALLLVVATPNQAVGEDTYFRFAIVEELDWPEETEEVFGPIDIFEKVEVEEVVEIEVESPAPVVILSEPEQIDSFTMTIGRDYGIEPELIQSIIWHESRYKPDLVNSIGCMGLMQICTQWHIPRIERLGVTNLLDSYQNILVGVDILSGYMSQGDLGLALMLYSGSHDTARALYSEGKLSWYAESVINRYEMLKRGEV